MKKFWQWLGFHIHTWPKWDDGEVIDCLDYYRNPNGGQDLFQSRRCTECNAIAYRTTFIRRVKQ